MATRGPYLKGIEKRQRILDAALEVIAVHGCRKAAVRTIAEAAGLTHAGLLHYFGSREALFEAVLRERDERDATRFAPDEPSFEDFLALVAYNMTVPGLVQLFIEYSAEASAPGHPSRDYFVARYALVRTALANIVRASQHSGEIGPQVHPTEAADTIMAASDGLQVQWSLDPSIDMVGRLRSLWDGIRRTSWALKPE